MIITIREIENGWLYTFDEEKECKSTVLKSINECWDRLKKDTQDIKGNSIEINFY